MTNPSFLETANRNSPTESKIDVLELERYSRRNRVQGEQFGDTTGGSQ